MVERTKRLALECRYWSAVRDINAGRDLAGAIRALIEITSASAGVVSDWARQTLADKFGCQLTISPVT